MTTIGFATKFYTLWDVSEEYTVNNGYRTITKRDYSYLKNLSFDLDKAKAKIKGEYNVDLNLRGSSSFSVVVKTEKAPEIEIEAGCFKFGSYKGLRFDYVLQPALTAKLDASTEAINLRFEAMSAKWLTIDQMTKTSRETLARELHGDCVKYSKWYYSETKDADLLALLITLGIMSEFEGDYYTNEVAERLTNNRYLTTLKSGHHYQAGERVELKIKQVDMFSFEGNFGRCYICTYADEAGRKFKYMGSSPKDISRDDFQIVKATVKLDNYKGEDNTMLQRMKVA